MFQYIFFFLFPSPSTRSTHHLLILFPLTLQQCCGAGPFLAGTGYRYFFFTGSGSFSYKNRLKSSKKMFFLSHLHTGFGSDQKVPATAQQHCPSVSFPIFLSLYLYIFFALSISSHFHSFSPSFLLHLPCPSSLLSRFPIPFHFYAVGFQDVNTKEKKWSPKFSNWFLKGKTFSKNRNP